MIRCLFGIDHCFTFEVVISVPDFLILCSLPSSMPDIFVCCFRLLRIHGWFNFVEHTFVGIYFHPEVGVILYSSSPQLTFLNNTVLMEETVYLVIIPTDTVRWPDNCNSGVI